VSGKDPVGDGDGDAPAEAAGCDCEVLDGGVVGCALPSLCAARGDAANSATAQSSSSIARRVRSPMERPARRERFERIIGTPDSLLSVIVLQCGRYAISQIEMAYSTVTRR